VYIFKVHLQGTSSKPERIFQHKNNKIEPETMFIINSPISSYLTINIVYHMC